MTALLANVSTKSRGAALFGAAPFENDDRYKLAGLINQEIAVLPGIFPHLRRLSLTTAIFVSLVGPSLLQAAPTLDAIGNISLPSLSVTDQPASIFSNPITVRLTNNGGGSQNGWNLSASVLQGILQGNGTGDQIPANVIFKTVTFISGASGSTIGISILPGGTAVAADPGFGRGRYDITFEVRFDVPAFPRSDQYNGSVSLSVQ